MDHTPVTFEQLCRDLEPEEGSLVWKWDEEVAAKDAAKDFRRSRSKVLPVVSSEQ